MSDREDRTEVDEVDEVDELDATGVTKREGTERRPRHVEPEAKLARGTLVGRYVVVDVLGEGGMGVVYAAYDPELDRKVAIKLLQGRPAGDTHSHGGQAWLLREAQALAKLQHPNVIAVHDVGTLPGDRIFVAMELVDGTTLRAWMKQPHTWREVCEVMRAAGAGLVAAHAAGLIHRDFKPENVLVGTDGRVRVMDFGLARAAITDEPGAARTSDLQIEARSPLSESLTIAGSVLGTPAYMAPEIFEAEPASPRSDQFAFGVTLYELLFRQRPYDKKVFATAPRPANLRPREPPKSEVPVQLQRIAMRAVAIDPAARFASMEALLEELARDPTARRRAQIYGAAGVAIVGAAVVATMKLTGGSPAAPDRSLLCTGADRHLTGIWDAPTKQAIRRAFDATDKPFKQTAFAAIEATLDRYTAAWTAAVTESCEATNLRGEQTAEVQSLRQDCFDQRLAVLRSFSGLLAKADDQLVEKASNAALALEREEAVARCADLGALRAPMQPTAEIKPRVLDAQTKLAEAHAAIIAGNFGRAINQANEAAALAKAIPFDPVYAEGRLVVGMATLQLGNQPDALVALGEAAWAGLRGRRDDIAATAALYSTVALTQQADKREQAALWLELGKAATVRAGNPDRLELLGLQTEGIVRANGGDLLGAVAAHTRSLARATEVFGKDNPQLSQSHILLGASLGATGNYATALPHYQSALALAIAWLGKDHPDVAIMHSGLGTCYHNTGDTTRARKEFARAIEIRERVFGTQSPILIPTLNNTAEMMFDVGELDEALVLSTRAKQLLDKFLGNNHPYFPVVTSTYALILGAKHRLPEARGLLDEAVAVAERTRSSYLGGVLADRAKLARAENQWAKSTELDTRAVAAFEAIAGKDSIDLWKPLTGLGLAKLHDGKADEARPHLERALAIATKASVNEVALRELRAAIAKL